MATLVFFHAHPDDEAIATSGTMARAVAEGHDVVLVVATRGEHGEPVPGVLAPGEDLWERRVAETHASAALLGVGEVVFLGYRDSGMMGEATNDDPSCFWQASIDEAADRLASVLRDVRADVVTVYDAHGGYGHPDHIQVHRVGHRAASLAGLGAGQLFESTMNRTHIAELLAQQAVDLGDDGEGVAAEAVATERASDPDFGTPAEDITHAIDVAHLTELKRASIAAHASQVAADSFFLSLPDEHFAMAFGTEWYIDPAAPRRAGAPFVVDLLARQ